MKVVFQFLFLIISLFLLGCKNDTQQKTPSSEKQIVEIPRDSVLIDTSSEKTVLNSTKVSSHIHYEYYFVGAKTGIHYRDKPKGNIIGKFPLNTQLKVIEYPKIYEQVENDTLKREWWGVEKETDTVYVLNTMLSLSFVVSDIKIYNTTPYYKEEDGLTRTAFVNMSETFYQNKGFEDNFRENNLILNENDFLQDTIKLDINQRKNFLKKINISESDKIFIYEIEKDSVITYRVQELPLIACVNIYSDGRDYEKSEDDYEFGFDLGKSYTGSYDNFTYVGKKNPFQTNQLKPIIWKEADPKNFPVQFGEKIVHKEIRRWFEGAKPKEGYKFQNENFVYYLQNLERDGETRYRYLVIIDSENNEIILNDVIIDSESTYLIPLSTENEKYEMSIQWTGKLFKDKPPVLFGLLGHSFGCPSINFLSKTEPHIQILCDNRH